VSPGNLIKGPPIYVTLLKNNSLSAVSVVIYLGDNRWKLFYRPGEIPEPIKRQTLGI